MSKPIYHITHAGNLRRISDCGCLWSDAKIRASTEAPVRIGYSHIKDRRMRRPIHIAARGVLGAYVPFNFCPRSVMLYVISQGLVDGYDEGQRRVVHLVSSTTQAAAAGRPWAFTDRHAEPPEAHYFDDLEQLAQLKWEIIHSNTWGGDERRSFKQAEFLVHESFPWTAIQEISVMTAEVQDEVATIIRDLSHRPNVCVRRQWYY